MKTKLAGLFLWCLSVQGFAASHPWSRFEGCYQTVERNGEAVAAQPMNVTELKIEDALFVTDLEGKPIPSMNFIIFQKFSKADDTYYYDYQTVFQDLGTYTENQCGDHFAFHGKLTYMNSTVFTMTSSATIQERADGKIFLKTKRSVPEASGHFDTDDEYVLEKKDCRQSASANPLSTR